MRFRIILHHFRSWEQLHFHAMGVFAAVDYAWLIANYRKEEKDRAGRVELGQHLHPDAFTTIRKRFETSLKAHDELQK